MTETINIEDLHAYVDGQLPPDRMAKIEAHLRIDPQAAAQVRDYRAINAALRDAFAHDVSEPERVIFSPIPASRRPLNRVAMAAAVAGVLLGTGAGWTSRGMLTGESGGMQVLAERTTAAYQVFAPDAAHPVEVAANESDRLASWLSNRMKMNFRIPQLTQAGFKLVGGRLMAADGQPAGMLMYENGQGRRIVLYIRNDLPIDGPSKMRYRRTDAGSIIYWRDAAVAVGVTGGFSEQELMPVANLVRASFAS